MVTARPASLARRLAGMQPPGSARPKGNAPESLMSVSSPVSPRESRRANELAQRREDALAAAASVFAAKGYHDAQMTEIAARAELSRASLYSMFTGKEELYQHVISSGAEAVRDAVHEKVEALDDPGDQLLCVIDSLFSCYEENQDLLRIYVLGTKGLPFKIRQAMGDSLVKISLAASLLGRGITILLSPILPGRVIAGERRSGLLVAAMTITFPRASRPSSSVWKA